MNTYQQNMAQADKHLANAKNSLHRALCSLKNEKDCAMSEFARAKGLARAARVCKDRAKLGGYGFIGKVR